MAATLTTFEVPLRLDPYGVIRVGQTRATLATIVEAFQRGDSPEIIARHYPAVTLAEVYGTIASYLQHQPELDAYLQEQLAANPLIHDLMERSNPVGLRDQLLARQAIGHDNE